MTGCCRAGTWTRSACCPWPAPSAWCCIAVLDFLRSACFVAIGEAVAGGCNEPGARGGGAPRRRRRRAAGPNWCATSTRCKSFLTSGAVAVPLDALCAPIMLAVLFMLHPAFGFLALAGVPALVFASAVTGIRASPALLDAQTRRRAADGRLSRSLAEPEVTDWLWACSRRSGGAGPRATARRWPS